MKALVVESPYNGGSRMEAEHCLPADYKGWTMEGKSKYGQNKDDGCIVYWCGDGADSVPLTQDLDLSCDWRPQTQFWVILGLGWKRNTAHYKGCAMKAQIRGVLVVVFRNYFYSNQVQIAT
ncbi:unnamed protein product [Boreogadus saida]